jgi:hypothetical protein
MAMTPGERKMWLGDGGLTKVAKRTRRTLGHVSQVNKVTRRDPVVERAIVKAITKNNPNIAPADVWPERVSA